MRRILAFLFALPATLLPARYRPRTSLFDEFDIRPAAMVSGIVQMAIIAVLWWLGYRHYVDLRVGGAKNVVVGMAEKGGETAIMGYGVYLLIEYCLLPQTLLLFYFLFEGGVRFVAAFVHGELVPTLPLVGVAALHTLLDKKRDERELPPLVIDKVERVDNPDCQLRIWTCRVREWNNLTTISYEDELYEVVRHEIGALPRPVMYELRRKPEGKIVRGLHHYSPDELLPKE